MKKLVLGIAVIGCANATIAQHNMGIANNNWGSINGVFLNPANIAESREYKSITFAGISYGADNNAGAISARAGFKVAVGDGKSNNMFRYSNNSSVSMMAPFMNITGPCVMLRLGKNNSIAFTSRLRAMNQFNDFDQTLFRSLNDPTYVPTENNQNSLKDFVYTLNLWSELGVTYAGVLYKKGHHKLKGGATLRYLGGIAYVALQGNNMDVRFTQGTNTFFASNTDLTYMSNILNTRNAQGNDISKGFITAISNGNFGRGVSGDLGLVYEYKPADSKKSERYKSRFSLALCDVGSIVYNEKVSTNERITGEGNLKSSNIITNVKNFENMRNYVVANGYEVEITKKSVKLNMPARLMLASDVHLQKEYYLNFSLLVNLANRQILGNSYYNQFTITPRYETKKMSIGIPLTYSTLSNSFKTGVGLFYKGFFVGSDDMLAIVSRSQYGINLYAGINMLIYK